MTITRRATLKSLLATMALASKPGLVQAARRRIPWKNWAGSESCFPAAVTTPQSMDELLNVLASSNGVVRAVGSGHSWSPLVPTEGTILSLRKFNGLISHDADALTAKVGAGSKLNALGPILDDISQGMRNLPDIDEQSLAGAFATGTHGTGLNLPALHDDTEALTLVTANGEAIECSRNKNADLFAAAKVSMGSLGIITDVTLKNTANFNLKRANWMADLNEMLEDGQALVLAEKHRQFEFFYIPFSGLCFCQATDDTDEPATGRPDFDEGNIVEDIKKVRDLIGFSSGLRALTLNTFMTMMDLPPAYIDKSWITLTNERTVPIYEMEYQLPLEAGPLAMREIVDYLESNHPEFFVPIEYRYVDSDDAWLSEFFGRKSVSISVHRYREGIDPWKVFKPVQEIFLKYDGRPHWGKVHNLSYETLKALYPKLDEFRRLREALDPERRFANRHIAELFGLSGWR